MGVRVSRETISEWNSIRQAYIDKFKIIDKVAMRCGICQGTDTYFHQWKFTPIEKQTWQLIRYHGLTFYPQIPILKYFIDFGNPIIRVGLEVDGQLWHSKEKDRNRDCKLKQIGWQIFRATGSEVMRYMEDPCYEKCEDYENDENYKRYLCNSVEGLIMAISNFYFDRCFGFGDKEFWTSILDTHKLV